MRPTVLIVDDHAAFRTWARRLLDCEGFDVVGDVADGASGLARSAELQPDVVLLDVHLPDLSGMEVTRRLRGRAPTAAVVLISSRAEVDLGGAVRECGARGFIPKEELSGARLASLLRTPGP